ncbi:MAG: hypothetical protein SFT68_00850 [Rickettsiaceae bacterium]|nr:hypothetical protein [Rickettsiaceae bacterium]
MENNKMFNTMHSINSQNIKSDYDVKIKFGSQLFIHRYCSALRTTLKDEVYLKFLDKFSFNGSSDIGTRFQ